MMQPITRQQRQHVPLPQKSELVWGKVSGWPWWPARIIPEPKKREDGQDGALVCFLVDKTLARIHGSLPFEDVSHYYRFLNVAYGDKRLMQAVEEGRALLLDSTLPQQASQTSPAPESGPLLLPYPAPTKEDVERRSARQLLKWLRGAAVAPEVSCNTFRDQQTKRVLHAVRNNRTECQAPIKAVSLQGAGCPAPGSAAAAATTPAGTTSSNQLRSSTPGLRPQTQLSGQPDQQRSSKRQRKPQAWLQNNCAVLLNLLQSTANPSPGGDIPSSGSSRHLAEVGGVAGSSTPRPLALPSDPSLCRSARLKQRVLNSLGQAGPSKGDGLPSTAAAAAAGRPIAASRDAHRKQPRLWEDQQQRRRQGAEEEDDEEEYYMSERPAKVIRLTVCKGSHVASSVPSERAWLEEQQQQKALLKHGARAGAAALHVRHSSHDHVGHQRQHGSHNKPQLKPWQTLHRHASCPGNASSSCGGAAAADSDADCGYSSEDEEDVDVGLARHGRAGEGLKRRMLSLNPRHDQLIDKKSSSRRWSTPDGLQQGGCSQLGERESGGSPTVGGSAWKGRDSFRGSWDGGAAECRPLGQLRAGGVISSRGAPVTAGWREAAQQQRQQQQQQYGQRCGQQSPSLVVLREPLEEHVVLLDHDHLGQNGSWSGALGHMGCSHATGSPRPGELASDVVVSDCQARLPGEGRIKEGGIGSLGGIQVEDAALQPGSPMISGSCFPQVALDDCGLIAGVDMEQDLRHAADLFGQDSKVDVGAAPLLGRQLSPHSGDSTADVMTALQGPAAVELRGRNAEEERRPACVGGGSGDGEVGSLCDSGSPSCSGGEDDLLDPAWDWEVQKDVPLDPDLKAELDAAADTGAAAAKAALARLKSVASSTAELLKKAALEADEAEAAAAEAMVGRQQAAGQQVGNHSQKGRLSAALRPGADPVQQLQAEVERKEEQLATCRAELAVSKESAGQLRQQLSELQASHAEAESELEELRKSIGGRDKEVAEKEKDILRAKDQVQLLEDAVKRLVISAEQQQALLQQKEAELARLASLVAATASGPVEMQFLPGVPRRYIGSGPPPPLQPPPMLEPPHGVAMHPHQPPSTVSPLRPGRVPGSDCRRFSGPGSPPSDGPGMLYREAGVGPFFGPAGVPPGCPPGGIADGSVFRMGLGGQGVPREGQQPLPPQQLQQVLTRQRSRGLDLQAKDDQVGMDGMGPAATALAGLGDAAREQLLAPWKAAAAADAGASSGPSSRPGSSGSGSQEDSKEDAAPEERLLALEEQLHAERCRNAVLERELQMNEGKVARMISMQQHEKSQLVSFLQDSDHQVAGLRAENEQLRQSLMMERGNSVTLANNLMSSLVASSVWSAKEKDKLSREVNALLLHTVGAQSLTLLPVQLDL